MRPRGAPWRGVAQEGPVLPGEALPSSPSGRGCLKARRVGVSGVIIGVDPHKVSATIEVLGDGEQVLETGRFGTDRAGYRAMLAAGRCWPERTWAVEGCQGIGRHVAQRLVADGETVVDVPAKLSARARVFSTGQGRKTDATDTHPSRWSRPVLRRCGRSRARMS